MQKKVNIIIPAITINSELLKCLREINKIYYSNFFVTNVLNHDSAIKIPRTKYKIKKMVSGKINMSKKRNDAVKKSIGEYIIFLDGDCLPFKDFIFEHIKLSEKGFFCRGNRIKLSKEFTNNIGHLIHNDDK